MTIKKRTVEQVNDKRNAGITAKSNYSEASEYIKCAISALGEPAKNSDQIARESIANLSVVLMDLQ